MKQNMSDLNALMSMLGGNEDLMNKLNNLSMMLGNPEEGDKVSNILSSVLKQEGDQIEGLSRSMAHTEPAINLLIAIKPFLSENKQVQLEETLKPLNMTYLVRKMGQIEKLGN